MTKKNRTKAQEMAEATRAFQLHGLGLSVRRISEIMTKEVNDKNSAVQMGMEPAYKISPATVARRIQFALDNYAIPGLEEAKRAELVRLDAIIEAQAEAVNSGSTSAAAIQLKAIKLRADILGLNAPTQSSTTNTIEVKDQSVMLTRIQQARAKALEAKQEVQVVDAEIVTDELVPEIRPR